MAPSEEKEYCSKPHKATYSYSFKLDFPCSNNVSEYDALILGLRLAKELDLGVIEVKGDSKLVTNQVNGDFHVKELHLAPYRAEAQSLINQTGSTLDHTGRSGNRHADALTTLARKMQLNGEEEGTVAVRRKEFPSTWKEDLAFEEAEDSKRLYIEDLTRMDEDRVMPTKDFKKFVMIQGALRLQRLEIYWPSMFAQAAALQDSCADCQAPPQPAEVCTVEEVDWRQPYIDFIQHGKLPSDRQATLRIQKKGTCFFMHEGVLYRRSYSNAMLRCMSDQEAMEVMTRPHEAEHQGMWKLFLQLYKGGFYWPTVESDTAEHVRKCLSFQMHGTLIRAPHTQLHNIVTPWPFHSWGLDIIGPINPTYSKHHKYIITATEYASKWVQAIPLKDYAGATVAVFIKEHTIYRLGAPMIIRADNARLFVNKDVIDFLRQYNIRLHTSTPYYPQGNGQA
ncbi:uncharacterized protein LOC113343657 [Papaver somniferum]|uniref:uncharacterized protein LOC113343657 n=1 Tax=Papaver somniferum TaxID=3469 RepID=UPI000E700FA7|nr:uncharacterized protein LOC113343657 [Papaver somniferum]